jgi:hypothetical protein
MHAIRTFAAAAFAICAGGATAAVAATPAPVELDRYNVVWTAPSKDSAGSMPLGNGQVGLNLWVEQNGDLIFYVDRTDSYSEASRLLKVGRVRVSLSPNPFAAGSPFRQELRLRDGLCEIAAGQGNAKTTLRVFVDAEQPVIHVLGESAAPLSVKATVECWRTKRTDHAGDGATWTMCHAPFPVYESADVLGKAAADAVVWRHRNEESVVGVTLKHQGLESVADKAIDPLLHRTFGGWMTAPGFAAEGDHTLVTPAPVKSFALRIAAPCAQTATVEEWMELARKTAADSADAQQAMQRTVAWWQAFWGRSWVLVSGGTAVVPGAKHPLRIGHDSNGGNVFHQVGGWMVFGRALEPTEIASLAAEGPKARRPRPVEDGLLAGGAVMKHEVAAESLDFSRGFTIAAWIKPAASQSGRIFDKLTAGHDDGFLLDVQPKGALRFILGSNLLRTPEGLVKDGQWQHVAATLNVESGGVQLYLDGKRVAIGAGACGTDAITRGYTLQRYVQACGGRGPLPIKFNGSMFTVEPKALADRAGDADYRLWGDCHWWQNVRLPYHPMLASGDFEMMDPLMHMYESVRPLCEARATLYHGVKGCYFPETMTIWGTYSNMDYGWDRGKHKANEVLNQYWRYAWNQGPELVALMLDRYDYTGDQRFLKQEVLPMAESVLAYFDTRFKRDAGGKIVLDPAQSIETYWFGVINDMPSVAALNDISARLCSLPEELTAPSQRAFFAKMKAACPAIPTEEVVRNGKKIRKLAPAEKYENRTNNCENPELYAVWPLRLYGLGKPGLDEARAAYAMRRNHLDVGWGQDGDCAARLGLTDEAARILKVKAGNSHPAYRWPATWGPNFDWLPDQDHGSNLLETTQLMLLQADGDAIRLLPAWPKDWDVHFKLHAPRNTTVECVYRGGKIEKLDISPETRRKDVILPGQ